jgi:hypothetical protein
LRCGLSKRRKFYMPYTYFKTHLGLNKAEVTSQPHSLNKHLGLKKAEIIPQITYGLKCSSA